MVKFDEISVVVQGAVCNETKACLRSIRRYLPGAEIILSTWNGTDVSDLDYDKLVLNKDPGSITINSAFPPNNVNRQLISTQGGLRHAKRKYTLKLRSDLILKSAKFLKYFDKFPSRNKEYAIFKHRMITSTFCSREVFFNYNFLFHPSDFWFFGLTSDICDYWLKTPVQKVDYVARYKRRTMLPDVFDNLGKYAPEQWYCINWAKRHFPDIVFDDFSDANPDAVDASKNILYNNFIFIGPYQSGIWSKKHAASYRNEYSVIEYIKGLITYELFQERYQQLCDKNYVRTPDRYKYLYKMRKNFEFLRAPFKYIIKYTIRIARALYYAVMYMISRD